MKFKCLTVERFIHTCMLHSALAELICTISNVYPSIFVRNVLKLAYLFY